jgi:hypothetical protein
MSKGQSHKITTECGLLLMGIMELAHLPWSWSKLTSLFKNLGNAKAAEWTCPENITDNIKDEKLREMQLPSM